jgi:ferrous iron transport protein B
MGKIAEASDTLKADKVLKIKKIAIVGLPNTGKSQVFNNLTGEYTVVANYPGTTVEMKRTMAFIDDRYYEIVDTPGLHCLYIHSEEELAVRDMLFCEEPDIVIQCIDANQYKQSLRLTAELLELEIPLVIVLNAFDEAARLGVRVDAADLERLLGVIVVEFNAIRGIGKEALKKAIAQARKSGADDLTYGFRVEDEVVGLAAEMPLEMRFRHKIASLLLLSDPYLEKFLEKKLGKSQASSLMDIAGRARRRLNKNIRALIEDKRSRWADEIAAVCVKKQKSGLEGFSHYAGQACRHPVLGIPIFLCSMAVVYWCVVNVSGFLDKSLNFLVVRPALGLIESLALPLFWSDFLIGNHGLLTIGIFNAICTVLPILSVFFFVFSFFEDSGYIANFCVFSKRVFEKIGVTGKAITPLVLGFGCKTMATLHARGLATPKEKLIAIFLIAFAIPCSAQLGISIAILGKVGAGAFVIAFGVLALFEVAAGVILNRFIKEEEENSFIQLLAPMRFPDMRAVAAKTYYRIVSFLKEAVPIFIISALALFVFEKIGLLDIAKKMLSPLIVFWLGLPRDIIDVFVLALARREAAAGLIFKMVDAGALNYVQSIVAVVLTATLFPCFANVIAIRKELGTKVAVVMTGLICVSSLALVGALHWILVFGAYFI